MVVSRPARRLTSTKDYQYPKNQRLDPPKWRGLTLYSRVLLDLQSPSVLRSHDS